MAKKLKSNVSYDVCDWKQDFTSEQVAACAKYAGGKGMMYLPDIGHIVDSKLLVVGPAGMEAWLEENAILIHDLPDDRDGLYWDGKELYVLDGEGKVTIEDHFESLREDLD